jgi:glutathione transport system permease protein
MFNYLVKRLFGLFPTLIIVAVLVFWFVHLLPGDPARLAAGADADEVTVSMIRHDLGLDLPLHRQFARFFGNALRGDFGVSIRSKRPVSAEISDRFMPTLWLTMASMAWSVIFGMTIGITSAVWRNRWPDRVGMTLAVSGISFPSFALGMLLMEVFSVWLGWLPAIGADSWRNYILPSLTRQRIA